MARTDNLTNFLTDVADSIRIKKGTTEKIQANNFDTEIESIESGDLSEYFSDTITAGTSSMAGWENYILKLPAMTNSGASCAKMFEGYPLTSLDLSNFDTKNVNSMQEMFYECLRLTSLDLSSFNTENVNNMGSMFAFSTNLKSIDLSSFDTSKVTDMTSMFYRCGSLKGLDLSSFDTSNVTTTRFMFKDSGLTEIPQLNTINVIDMSYMLDTCGSLISIPLLNASSVEYINNFCTYSKKITTIGGLQNLGQAYDTTKSANYSYYKLDLSSCTLLTEQSLINVLNNLYDIATKGCNTQQVVLGSTNLAKLTSEAGQQALTKATSYGWTVL